MNEGCCSPAACGMPWALLAARVNNRTTHGNNAVVSAPYVADAGADAVYSRTALCRAAVRMARTNPWACLAFPKPRRSLAVWHFGFSQWPTP